MGWRGELGFARCDPVTQFAPALAEEAGPASCRSSCAACKGGAPILHGGQEAGQAIGEGRGGEDSAPELDEVRSSGGAYALRPTAASRP